MRKNIIYLNLLLVAAITLSMVGAVGSQAQTENKFADPSFQQVWTRTDALVASDQVHRSYYWGQTPGVSLQEPYTDAISGTRLVQYFEKSRMEINDPSGDRKSKFFVTNGLLTVELVTGKIQTGSSSFEPRKPADIPLASDIDDATAPTYASFTKLMGKAEDRTGQSISLFVDRDGTTHPSITARAMVDVKVAYYEPSTGHNIAKPIWDFLHASGPVINVGASDANGLPQIVTETLSDPWFYATGLPITEPYWATVKIGGQFTDVLIQPFERRVVTYAPLLPADYQVQMGNIGIHYYNWRYKSAGATTPPGPTAPDTGASPTPAPPPGGVPSPLPGGRGTLPLTLTIAKPVIARGEDQTVTVNTQPKAHVTILCADQSGSVFNNPCFKDGHGASDVNGAFAFTWTIPKDAATGVMTVTAIANLGSDKVGLATGSFQTQ